MIIINKKNNIVYNWIVYNLNSMVVHPSSWDIKMISVCKPLQVIIQLYLHKNYL